MTKFLTASRRRCSSAAFTRTRHETMMTTNLLVVELYNVVDRQSPRTQSADTQPLLLDCSRRPETMVRHSSSGFDERILVSAQVAPENTAYDRPPTSINKTRVPLNSAQNWPQQFGLPSRYFSTKNNYVRCRTLTSATVLPQPNWNYSIETILLDTDW